VRSRPNCTRNRQVSVIRRFRKGAKPKIADEQKNRDTISHPPFPNLWKSHPATPRALIKAIVNVDLPVVAKDALASKHGEYEMVLASATIAEDLKGAR
jgi:hypothetical protein